MIDPEISNNYFNPSKPGAFSGAASFIRTLKNDEIPFDGNQVLEWINDQEPYTLHKYKRKRFQRARVIVAGIDDTWQIDLVDMQKYASENNKIRYILMCIDCFSKFAWAEPVVNKSGIETAKAMKNIFKSTNRKPKSIQFDKGTEFLNTHFKKLLDDQGIKYYHIETDKKACIVERLNRTIKEKMWRFFTHSGHFRYIHVLHDLIKNYNSCFHRTIKMRPMDVKKENEEQVRTVMYGNGTRETIKFNFKVGDSVRISKRKGIFEKGYTPNWTQQVFKIEKRLPRIPPIYKIKDLLNETQKGIFYEKQLQLVSKEEVYFKLDTIIRTREIVTVKLKNL
jgi:hypothetical protein